MSEFKPANISAEQSLINDKSRRGLRYVAGIVVMASLAACSTTKATSAEQNQSKTTPTTSSPAKAPTPTTTTSPSVRGGLNTNFDLCNTVSSNVISEVIGVYGVNCTPNIKTLGGDKISDSNQTVNAMWAFPNPKLASETDEFIAFIQPSNEPIHEGKLLPEYLNSLSALVGPGTPGSTTVLGHPATMYGFLDTLTVTLDDPSTGAEYYLDVSTDWPVIDMYNPNDPELSPKVRLINLASTIIQNGVDAPNNVFSK